MLWFCILILRFYCPVIILFLSAPHPSGAFDSVGRLLAQAETPVFQAEEAKKGLIGLARDLRGLAYAFNTKTSYMMLFDWMYPLLASGVLLKLYYPHQFSVHTLVLVSVAQIFSVCELTFLITCMYELLRLNTMHVLQDIWQLTQNLPFLVTLSTILHKSNWEGIEHNYYLSHFS